MVGWAALLTACGNERQREQERTEQRNKELGLMTNMTLAGHPRLSGAFMSAFNQMVRSLSLKISLEKCLS